MGMGSYRSDRIGKQLAENNQLTVKDMAVIHYDFYSNQAALFMEILAPLLPEGGKADILRHWNFEYTAESEGAYLFDQFYKTLYRIVFGQNGLGVDAVDYLDQKPVYLMIFISILIGSCWRNTRFGLAVTPGKHFFNRRLKRLWHPLLNNGAIPGK